MSLTNVKLGILLGIPGTEVQKKRKLCTPWLNRNRDKGFKIVYSVLRNEGEEAAELLNAPQKQTCNYGKNSKTYGELVVLLLLYYF